jgi:hypothetical protein
MGQVAFEVQAIPAQRLAEMRAGVDDADKPVEGFADDEGGNPLRCCLRLSRRGERVALISYRPAGGSGAYSEVGPVFIHAEACEGYPERRTYPDEFRPRAQVFRAYDSTGTIIGGHLATPDEAPEDVIGDLFADQQVAFIHTRNVIFGCYMAQIRRAGTA